MLVRKTCSLAVTTGALSSAGPTRTSAQSSGTVSFGPSVTVAWSPPAAGMLATWIVPADGQSGFQA